MRRSLRFSPIVLLALAACSGAPESVDPTSGPSPSSPSATHATTLRLTHLLPRGGESTASVQSLPNAACALRVPGVADSMTVYSDDDGIARVHLRQLDSSVNEGELSLDCVDDSGAHLVHAITVRVDDTAVSQAPAAFLKAGKPTLPVIDVDPLTMDDVEGHRRGYPPRPDAAQSPDQYASWLALVSSGATKITPHVISDPRRMHGPAHVTSKANASGTSNNWSGYVITTATAASKYAWIYGEWHVPRAYAESGFASWDHSTMWVGIDGWGSNDVVQDGTDQDTLTGFWIQTSSYDAWTEWYPLLSQTISNFPVNPNDDIRAWTWLLDSNGRYSATPTVGWFYMWNATSNVAVEVSTSIPSGASFSGHSAEWVMERPTVLGSVSSLAQYASPTSLTNAIAYDVAGGAHQYTSDTSWQVTMTDSSNNNAVLSTVKPVNASTMAFTFVNHN